MPNTSPPTPQDIATYVKGIQRMLDQGPVMSEPARILLEQSKIPYEIVDGKLVPKNDQCETWLKKFITVNAAMLKVKDRVRKLAKVDDEVLISGPTGTGKELLAHALHGTREGQFLACNCAGFPEHLIESELFGHVRGAFTGAVTDKVGLMVQAKYGTLFLDEIGELPMVAQAKLLRVLAERKIRAVGSNETREITCRFVFATNRDLTEDIFRTDLLARISTFELHTLSLNERQEDCIPILKSLGADETLLTKLWGIDVKPSQLHFNVRSLEQIVKRYKLFGEI